LLEGDKVETSGLGGIYPKGITVGTIKSITNTKNLTNRYAMVEPAVNFNKVETVLVIIN
jgi:rod shape-determining protein MreC